MPELSHKQFDTYIASPDPLYPVYVVCGDEYLCRRVRDQLVGLLLPDPGDRLNYDVVDPLDGGMSEAIHLVNTYALLSGPKVVVIREDALFGAKSDPAKTLEKVRQWVMKDNLPKAAKQLMVFLAEKKAGLSDYLDSPEATLGVSTLPDGFDHLTAHLRDNSYSVPETTDSIDMLLAAIEKGLPSHNRLIVLCQTMAKNKKTYKKLAASSLVIDCRLPTGERQADKTEREHIFRSHAAVILSPLQKRLEPAALNALADMTGADLRTFTGSLKKLADYVGDRGAITVKDVKSLLTRTRQDPIYEFTGAVADQNLPLALNRISTLLDAGMHELQIQAALMNQVRKLILAKDFTQSTYGRVWQAGMTYQAFQQVVMPEIMSFDDEISQQISDYSEACAAGRKKKSLKSDLYLAKSSKSPYPVYLLLLKSDKYAYDTLLNAMISLASNDARTKLGHKNPRVLMEEVVIRLCRPAPSPA